MDIKIRKLHLSDIEYLRTISIQTFSETFAESNSEEDMQNYIAEKLNIEELRSEILNTNSEFYFAETETNILGYLKLNSAAAQTENQSKNALEIERIYVLKDFLGMKVGQILFEKAVHVANERKANYVWLGVWEENKRAINFYEKNGFVVFGKHDFKLGDDVQTDLMMKLNLN